MGSTSWPTFGFSPVTQRQIDHGQANPCAAAPSPTGTGLATGSCGAIRPSQRCSVRRLATAQWIRGSRTAMSVPSRYMALSVPAESIGVSGRSAQCGNWVDTSRRTSDASMSTSSACILAAGALSRFSNLILPSGRSPAALQPSLR